MGTDRGSWGRYDPYVWNTTIRNCTLGPYVSAEAFDIKEGTQDTLIEFNTVDATGISDANYADSFVDIKAARTIVRYNTFIRNEAEKLEKGIAIIYRGTDYSAYEIVIHDNYYYLVSFEAMVCGTLNTMDALVSNPSFFWFWYIL